MKKRVRGVHCIVASVLLPMASLYAAEYSVTTVVNGSSLCTTTAAAASTISGSTVWSMATDSQGNLYFPRRSFGVICKLMPNGNVVNVGGSGTSGAGIDNGPATSSPIVGPISIAVDPAGNIYVSEYDGNYSIRKIDTSGVITTLLNSARTRSLGAAGSSAYTTTSYSPMGLAISPSGELYYSEYSSNQIRKIDLNGNVQIVAGTGATGNTGDGGAATSASLNAISDIDFDSAGNIYLTSYNGYIRKINTNGIISRFAGSYLTRSHTGDNGQALSATFQYLWQIAFDGADNIFIPERGGSTIRKIDSSGIVTTIAGLDGTTGTADGQSLTAARFNQPFAVAVANDGSVYISDFGNNIIRKIAGAASGAVSPISLTYNPVNSYRLASSITASGGQAGKITFYADGKRIAGCISRTYSNTYICSWKPSKIGATTISVKVVAQDGSTQNSNPLTVNVIKRSNAR